MIGPAFGDVLYGVDDLVQARTAALQTGIALTHIASAIRAGSLASRVVNGVRYVSLADVRAWQRDCDSGWE
ncbi:MAG: hypothetical protein AB7J28_16680 [Hyphomonadaceae bacterium]